MTTTAFSASVCTLFSRRVNRYQVRGFPECGNTRGEEGTCLKSMQEATQELERSVSKEDMVVDRGDIGFSVLSAELERLGYKHNVDVRNRLEKDADSRG